MSSVRMCDRCGNIFSERQEGWQTYSGTQMIRNKETGERNQITVRMDACPACSVDLTDNGGPTPKLSSGDETFFARAALEQENKSLKEKLAKEEAKATPKTRARSTSA